MPAFSLETVSWPCSGTFFTLKRQFLALRSSQGLQALSDLSKATDPQLRGWRIPSRRWGRQTATKATKGKEGSGAPGGLLRYPGGGLQVGRAASQEPRGPCGMPWVNHRGLAHAVHAGAGQGTRQANACSDGHRRRLVIERRRLRRTPPARPRQACAWRRLLSAAAEPEPADEPALKSPDGLGAQRS